ncbi:MAG TPA: hypothetical protein VFY45_02555 [Baekduia sp.]|nr:hypothetical protein [Baekduia sp.]
MNARLTEAALGAVLLAVVVATFAWAAPAKADYGIKSFSNDAFHADGVTLDSRAGAHPFGVTTKFRINGEDETDSRVSGYTRDIRVRLPRGFIGNPEVAPKCPRGDFATILSGDSGTLCPPASQIGTAITTAKIVGQDGNFVFPSPVYNVEPLSGQLADLALAVGAVPVHIIPTIDAAGDYSLRVDVNKLSQGVPLLESEVTLWGVPGDAAHDSVRSCGAVSYSNFCYVKWDEKPFLTNPMECGVKGVSTLAVDSWEQPDVFHTASYTSPESIMGCDRLRFNPSLDAAPTTRQADAPSGLSVDLAFPQNENPDVLATPPLRTVKVTLPEGMTINPASASGLEACTDAQLGLGSDSPVGCPDGAKIGTVTATSPALADPLLGAVYLRSQASSDPSSGDMFRLALVLENKERGLLIKLPGSVKADPTTGRLVSEFSDNPQLPVSKISLSLKPGSRAPLATPSTCGTKSIDADLTSWAGQTAHRESPFAVNCAAGLGDFAPSFTAGATNPTGGAFSPFDLSISKPDGNTDLAGLSMTLPTGLVAQLKGNLGAQVGTVKAFAGPGSDPFMLPGQVYLEGAYGDAPFSLKVVVPAKAGPFDLGEVVVRQKIYVDPTDAHVTVVSDPIPTIVKGVPVRLQRLDVSVDKPGFMINPTSCAAKSIEGALKSVADQTAGLSVRFQVGDCASLGLKPSLGMTLSGKGQTTDGKHPAVTANLTQPTGQANLKKVRVALPLSLALDTDNANGLCEFVDGSKVTPTCPKNSIVGTATATTPILDEPLSGPVYFVKNIRKDPKSGRDIRTLPKLVIPLTGQNGVKLTLTGTSDVVDDQLVTTFDNIPDAPVSGFKLSIIGGKGGILTVSGTDICKATQVADQQINGQNNKTANTDVYIQTPSCTLKVLSKKVGKSSVAVKVGGLGAGKVTITGHGIKKTTKTITKSTVATITAKRTKGKPGKVTVSFDPTGPAKARKTTK